jgi:hypothetical protein
LQHCQIGKRRVGGRCGDFPNPSKGARAPPATAEQSSRRGGRRIRLDGRGSGRRRHLPLLGRAAADSDARYAPSALQGGCVRAAHRKQRCLTQGRRLGLQLGRLPRAFKQQQRRGRRALEWPTHKRKDEWCRRRRAQHRRQRGTSVAHRASAGRFVSGGARTIVVVLAAAAAQQRREREQPAHRYLGGRRRQNVKQLARGTWCATRRC